jgi:transposase
LECYRQGLPIAQIAQQMHLARATVYTYLAAESFPRSASAGTGNLLAPYTAYLRKRCEEGCQNAQQLYREIHTQGFSGNPRTVLRWLQAQGLFPRRYELRQAQDGWSQRVEKESASTSVGEDGNPSSVPEAWELTSTIELTERLSSARQLSYLLVKDPSRLKTKEQQALACIQQEQEIE